MNWDAIGALGEIVGAAAVVFSLVYLSIQIRLGAQATQDSATRDIFIAITSHLGVMSDPANTATLLKGLIDFDALEPAEKMTFDKLMTGFVTLAESIFISAGARIVEDEQTENFAFYLRTRYFAYPGAHRWWEGAKGTFGVAAQDWVERQLRESDLDSDHWNIK